MFVLFASTYICEQTFSIMKINKGKNRSLLTDSNLQSVLRISTSNLTPNFDKLKYNNVDIILGNVRGHHSNLNTNIAAHVTGVAYRYTQADVLHYTWPQTKKPLEFAVHHKYGAWFTVPAVIVFPDFKLPSLLYPLPFDALPSHEPRSYILQSLHNEYRVHVFRLFAPIVEIITGTSAILDSLLLLTNCQERNFPSKICTNCGQPPLNIMDNHDEYYT
ncbi:Hypothetical predicted protein [Octopus vulgaris]|uniref:Cyanocobalamin reductase (cyanide-eliminating) n=1 Tax=Octopus vulgaris TaxID=6645 RepID=A0AA36B0L9_OCTVU|nr:Hypothetical predicted protein [Octopus vulgaris]